MSSTLMIVVVFLAQAAYGRSRPPSPVEDMAIGEEIEFIVVGRISKISQRGFSTTELGMKPPQTRYYDTGTIIVEKYLKGPYRGSPIEFLYGSNKVLGGPSFLTVTGKSSVFFLQRNPLNYRFALFAEYGLHYELRIHRALLQKSNALQEWAKSNPMRLCPETHSLSGNYTRKNEDGQTLEDFFSLGVSSISIGYLSADWKGEAEAKLRVREVLKFRPKSLSLFRSEADAIFMTREGIVAELRGTGTARMEIAGSDVCFRDSSGNYWYFQITPMAR